MFSLGLIVFHARHKNAKGPLHMVHLENWLVYCLFNTKSRRYELTVLEMYDGYTERNRCSMLGKNSGGMLFNHSMRLPDKRPFYS